MIDILIIKESFFHDYCSIIKGDEGGGSAGEYLDKTQHGDGEMA